MIVEKSMLAPGTSFATAYYVISSREPGPVFMIVSGIHGNEPASIRAAKELAGKFAREELFLRRGRLIILPLANQKAYRKRRRGVPDLNRTFPRSAGSRAGHPLAASVFALAQRYKPNWYLDLHEANGLSQINRRRVGQTLIISQGSRAGSLAKRIVKRMNQSILLPSHHFNIHLRERSGTSRMAAERILGARAVTVETCWSLSFAVRVRYQQDIVRHFLRSAGLIG
ncbi:succinylglutamate desuccinylase/aspartoacylase family protein [Paenibacillus sp. S150]|uniref:succinylglutamate desuccinylase/aspartoacylase family protein n=1 Tax=Paenibacillus sp. S150 TaxID=2749826 RepID=UPI001C56CF98|nr:succinylglutamate desuccinylase/aspartoacylase family protein [Paenibacillus sp. S150]MBW4080564.1 succinylglutamate desuccinylase/aspartoacylase family protein [Paenibacillus sp. S150]